jgi:hypothetical protein
VRRVATTDEGSTDETPFTTRIEGEKTTKTGFIYTFQSIRLCEEPKILIDFRMDRSRTGPRAFLADWTGVFLTYSPRSLLTVNPSLMVV